MKLRKQELWSKIIQKHRIRWFGHALRLPENTPYKQAIHESKTAVTRPHHNMVQPSIK